MTLTPDLLLSRSQGASENGGQLGMPEPGIPGPALGLPGPHSPEASHAPFNGRAVVGVVK